MANGLVIISIPARKKLAARGGMLGITRQKQDLQVRPVLASDIGKLASVDAGKPDIGDHQVEANVGLQKCQRRRAVGGLQRSITEFTENLGDKQSDRRIVLDQQNRFAGALARRWASRGIGHRVTAPW